MNKRNQNNIRLGLFVLIGTAFLIAALYLIGNNSHLFKQTFQITATFYKVNGLMAGNNVRFSGINVGTVKSIRIASDTSVEVTMVIESGARKFIKQNAQASVGTDGLMGNKLVEINNVTGSASPVEDGGVITTLRPIETDRMMRVLDQTNKDLSEITSGLKIITRKVNNSSALWSILSDSLMAENVRQSISSIRTTTRNTEAFSKNLNGFMNDVRNGKGMINYLVNDSLGAARLRRSMRQVDETSEKASRLALELSEMTARIKRGEGTAGIVLYDTAFVRTLKESLKSIHDGSAKLDENMEALKHSWPVRGYFKKQAKEQKERDAETGKKR